ncbi:unnamed protein product [Mytilus edulis]|uniref:Uncharacterized protein n=1 Tax=Mytilus edulis TaxID=6550 RepID=A0A8S3PSP5_MYTED|nr:unnamed protein product [Mytilus edulis]
MRTKIQIMARLDVPLVFCGSMFYTVVLLFHLTELTVSQNTTDSSTNTTIAPTSVYNGSNVSVTDSEATELFSSNYPSSSVSSNNSGESISPSSSSMFIDSTSNLSIAISVDSSSTPEMSISQTTDTLETNSPMISTDVNSKTNIYSTPPSLVNIASSEPINIISSVSEFPASSDSEGKSSVLATENSSLASDGTEMTSTPIVHASLSVFTNSMESDMPSNSETPVSSDIQITPSSVSSLGIVPSSTVIQTTSNSNIQVSSSVLPTTTTTTTTTTTKPPTSTLAAEIQSEIDGNSLFEVRTELDITCNDIKSDEDLRKFIQDEVLENVDAVRKVVVVKNSAISSLSSEVKLSVDGKTAANNASLVLDLIVEAFKNNTKLNFTNADAFRASGDKYGYDRRHSYEPMSDVIGRSGPAYYRNDSKNQQPGFTNLGYDDDKYSDYSDPSQTRPQNGQSWNPEDSKDTYAKINEQLDQEKTF